jgi:hypothetical protein
MRRTMKKSVSTGNNILLALVNSEDKRGYKLVEETILPALSHYGMPYAVHDIARSKNLAEKVANSNCILVSQSNIFKHLDQDKTALILQALKSGTGIVNFDFRIKNTHFEKLLNSKNSILKTNDSAKTGEIIFSDLKHYITDGYRPSNKIALSKSVPCCKVKLSHGVQTLVTGKNKLPLVASAKIQKGRLVQFFVSGEIWSHEVLGICEGIAPLLWKSIVWSAKKPFAMYAFPPFVTARVDDCSGSYDHFGYIDTFNKNNFIPYISLFLDAVDEVAHYREGEGIKKIRAMHKKGLAVFDAHAFRYNDMLCFDHLGKKPYTDKKIKEQFKRYDAAWKKIGLKPSIFGAPHFNEIGKNSLRYFKKRGVTHLSVHVPLNDSWFGAEGKEASWHPSPFDHLGYSYDYVPEAEGIFSIISRPTPRYHWHEPGRTVDFLWDNTMFWNESSDNNIHGAAEAGALTIAAGLNNLFWGELVTHEQRIAVLKRREFDEILGGVNKLLHGHKKIFTSCEHTSRYAQAKYHANISECSFDAKSKKIKVTLSGKTDIETYFYLFSKNSRNMDYSLCKVPPFAGEKEKTAAL